MGGSAVSGDLLAAAFESTLTGFTVYEDNVPGRPEFPYVFVLTNFPAVAGRSVTRRVQFRHLRARTTVVGLSATSVRTISQQLTDALEGKRLTVEGWNLGAIESVPNDLPIQRDLDVTIPGTAEHPLFQPFDWVLTGSQNPT